MTAMGDNGGPPHSAFGAKLKIQCIESVLDRSDLTTAQKCVGVGLIVRADKEWASAISTAELQRLASVKDRETVFAATRALDGKGIIAKQSTRGQAGVYVVLPASIIDAVAEAYTAAKSSRVQPDQSSKKQSGSTGRVSTKEPVGFNPTSPVKPVGLDPTSRVEPDQFASRVLDNNNYLLSGDISNNNNYSITQKPRASEGVCVREGENLRSSLKPAFEDPYDRVQMDQTGKPVLMNGLRQFWLNEFGGDAVRLDLALIEVAGDLQPNSRRSLESQVSSRLAKMARARRDQDERYARAVKRREASSPTLPARSKSGTGDRPLTAGEMARRQVLDGDRPREEPKTISVEWRRT